MYTKDRDSVGTEESDELNKLDEFYCITSAAI